MIGNMESLCARMAEIDAEIAAANAQLRDALLTGGNTASVREYLRAVHRERAETMETMQAADAAAEAAREAELVVAGRRIAGDVMARLDKLRAHLVVPDRGAAP
jgi:hypothetical protein